MGKTEVAKALAGRHGARLIRLQCHEGIDLHHALYDWDYPRQLLHLARPRAGERAALLASVPAAAPAARGARGRRAGGAADRRDRPRRRRVRGVPARAPVGLPGHDPRARDGHGASGGRWSCITSNRTRELHDALKRRCLYHWIDYPAPEREAEIVRARLPGVPDAIAERVCAAVARLRGEELYKLPGVGETIAWAQALLALDDADLDETLGVALKVREDIDARRASAGCCRVSDAASAPGCTGDGSALLAASMRAGGRAGRRRRAAGRAPRARRRRPRRPRAPPTSRCAPRCARATTTWRPSTPRSPSCSRRRAASVPRHRRMLDDAAPLVLPRVAVPADDGGPRPLDAEADVGAGRVVGRRAAAREGLRRLHATRSARRAAR